MDSSISCDLCGAFCPVPASYVVRMDVFADPGIPDMSGEALASLDVDQALADAVQEAAGMTADDLQDSVHRRFEFRLCPRCHRSFLANPLGKPRVIQTSSN